MRAYVFIDGENHFIRADAAATRLIGNPKATEALSIANLNIPGITGFPLEIKKDRFLWNKDFQFFWDCELLSSTGILTNLGARVYRAVYCCSYSGDEGKGHEIRRNLRNFDFEPIVINEPKNIKAHRENRREEDGLIEKPKGCDIAIATRMVADAAANLYDCCFLFTSDADFIPAVEAVRRMGKVVWVFGYLSALPKHSPFHFLPDRFVDLEWELKRTWINNREKISKALQSLGETGPFNEP